MPSAAITPSFLLSHYQLHLQSMLLGTIMLLTWPVLQNDIKGGRESSEADMTDVDDAALTW